MKTLHPSKIAPAIGIAILYAAAPATADEIARESFEGGSAPIHSSTGLISAPTQFYTGTGDFWTATTGATPAIVTGSNGVANYSGQNGSRYWAGQDLDASGSDGLDTKTMDFGPIPISGFINLSFTGLFAADGSFNATSFRYDAEEGLEVYWSIDGSAFVKALAFEADQPGGDVTNNRISKDANLDGIGDGPAFVLGTTFQSHSFSIPSTGSNLTIRLIADIDASQEEVAFDNLTIEGDPSVTNQAPAANSLNAAAVGEPQIGDTSYSFSIVYNDDSAIDVSTIGTTDVNVSGPSGFSTVTGVSVSPVGDGTPRTATYTATPPGGTWDAGDNGTHTVNVNAVQVGDDGAPQLFVPSGQVGNFSVNATNTPPVVDDVLAAHVINSDMGGGSYAFSVTYADVGGVNASSIGIGDVTVTGPGGPLTISSASATGPSGPSVTANYTVTPPGGTWDPADDGNYTIAIVAGQVFDVTGAAVAAGSADGFDVDSTCAVREGFEVGAPTYDSGLVTSADKFYSGSQDFWTDTDGNDINSASASPALYSGEEGRRYWAGQDLDQTDDHIDTVVIGPIPVSGFTDLSFSGLFAADGLFGGNPAQPRYDPGEGLEVAWSIDGSSFTTALAFKSESASVSNQNLRKDVDLNGVGEGGILGPVFSSHSFPIGSTGNNLTIRVTGILSASQEEVAFDDLKVNGTPSTANQAPVTNGLAAADVGEPEVGLTTYSFDITYSDESAIDVSTIGTADVTVTGPGGPLTVTGATSSPAGDGSPRTATYTVTPPGGSWDAADAGTYTVSVNPNQVADSDGLFVAAGAVGTFEAAPVNVGPTVDQILAPDVGFLDFGESQYAITITYNDFGGVSASSIDASDITVTGPTAIPLAVVSGSTTDPSGQFVTATYIVSPQGGFWDPKDQQGTYTVAINGSQVFDITAEAVVANSSAATFEFSPNCVVTESFEADAPSFDTGLVSSPDKFYASMADFWTDTDGSNISSGSGSPAIYTGEDGEKYWAGQDLDHADDTVDTVVLGPFSVEGFTGLQFSGLFAADGLFGGNASQPRYDLGEGIEVAYSLDGAPFMTGLAFKAEAGTNVNIRKDGDLNGVGEGAILGPNFIPDGFSIPSTGSELTIKVTGILSGSQEEVAFDKLKVTGDPPPFAVGYAPVSGIHDGSNVIVDLWNGFIDVTDTNGALSYAIVGNDNPGAFDSVSIDASDFLTLDFKPYGGGDIANIEIQATNTSGRSATTTLVVNIANPFANLMFLPDPIAADASSSTSNGAGGVFPVENLYDANPSVTDINTVIPVGGQWGGDGVGPHVVVYEFDKRIVFDSIGYVQRLGGIATADKVPSMEIWVSETDPGPASLSLPILSTPAAATTDLIEDTTLVLRHYPLGEFLTGRYVIFRLAVGTFNPGGAELALMVNAPTELEGLAIRDYETGLSIMWSSNSLTDYEVERSFDDVTWAPLTIVPGCDGATSYVDTFTPAGSPRALYRVNEVPPVP